MLWIPALAVALVAGYAVVVYNRLVSLRNRAEGAWSDIDVQLKRRHDLVANLVEVVRGYAAHERDTLEAVVQARSQAQRTLASAGPGAAGTAETDLSRRIRHLFALVEAYPELKASERFLDLHRALVEVEDAIQNARRYYNAVVRDYNTRIQSFPDLLLARSLGFRPLEFFELEDPAEAEAPRLSLERT